MIVFRTALAALALLATATCGKPESKPEAPAATATPAGALGGHPAMWKIADADTTIFLFGTVHILPPNVDWTTPMLDKALADAKAVYFETDVEPDRREMERIVTQLGVYTPPETLSSHLAQTDRDRLAAAASGLGIGMPQLDGLKPWLAAQVVSQQLILREGYDPESGAERSLYPRAVSAGKDIRKFETVQQQLMFFADLPEQTQIDYLNDGIAKLDEAPALLRELVTAWSKGDVDAIRKLMIEGDLADTPAVYEALLVNRNKAWAGALKSLLADEPGVFFVAVGAGHFAGKDSVLAMLDSDGVVASRVQ